MFYSYFLTRQGVMFLTILLFIATSYFFWTIFQIYKRTPEEIAEMEKAEANVPEYVDEAFTRDWVDKRDSDKNSENIKKAPL